MDIYVIILTDKEVKKNIKELMQSIKNNPEFLKQLTKKLRSEAANK